MKWLASAIVLLVFSASVLALEGAPPCSGTLDNIKFKNSGYEMTGDVVTEAEDSVTVIPENGGRVTLRRELIEEIQYDAVEPLRFSTEKFAEGFARCVLNLVGSEKEFRIIKVKPESLYINLGFESGMERGMEVSIYREGDEIVDPETKAVLGREKDLIGIIHVIGVDKDFSEAVPVDTPIDSFREGDTGVLLRKSPTIAVADITTPDGKESPYGSFLTGQIVENLHKDPELKIIEHKDLGSRLLDQLRGIKADAVLVGTVTEVPGGDASVNLRMVDTSSAAVLHSARKLLQNPEKPINPGGQAQKKAPQQNKATKKNADGEKIGRETDLLDRILHAIYER